MRRTILTIITILILIPSRSTARTRYVANTGSDSAAGTTSAPWRTLQHAADNSQPGDTFIVRAGSYVGFEMGWDNPQNGTADARIVFKADSGATITSRNAKTADGIDLEGASYITVDGFTITNRAATITRAGIRCVVDTAVIVRNNTIDSMGTWGIITGHSQKILIENNRTSRSGTQHGIYFGNSADSAIIRGNISYGNTGCGIHINADVSQGGDGIISYILVENNIIYNNGYPNGGAGINCDGVQNSRIQNNLLYNNHASGITLFQTDAAEPSKNDTLVNNTIIMAADGRWGIGVSDGSTGAKLYNNIVYSYHSFRGGISVDDISTSDFASDYNAVMDRFSDDGQNSVITLAAWRTATGQDQHSFLATPGQLFVDSASGNFHLKAGSPAIDAGTAAFSPSKDLDGNTRPMGHAVDVGAYEYGTSGTAAPYAAAVPAGLHLRAHRSGPSMIFDVRSPGLQDRGCLTVYRPNGELIVRVPVINGMAVWNSGEAASGRFFFDLRLAADDYRGAVLNIR